MNASPQDRLIVTQNQSFLKPRESGASPDPSREHAVASAALAASFKRATRKLSSEPFPTALQRVPREL
jgi:hypothetical protein